MDYRKAEIARDKLCDELDKVLSGNLNNTGELERLHKLASTIHFLDEVMEADAEMENGGSYGRGYPIYYGGGRYGARRGGYGNDGGYGGYGGSMGARGGQRRDSGGRYAAGGYEDHLRMAMEAAPDEATRQSIERMMR